MKQLYRFGAFYLDPTNKRLLKDEGAVQLAPKTFDTLFVLVEAKGNVVTKEELLDKVWQSSIVEENNLTQHISALRKIFGETADGLKYIETIPKRGYRFATPIEEVDDALIIEKHQRSRIVIEQQSVSQESVANISVIDAPTPIKTLPATRQKFWQARQKVIAACAVLALLIGGYGISRFIDPKSGPDTMWRAGIFETQLISAKTNTGERITSGRFSPDGKLVAYTAQKDYYFNIRITKIGSDTSRSLTDEKCLNQSPVWSPDGEAIAFLSDRGNQLGLWVVNSFGGTPKHIVNFEGYGVKGKEGVPSLKMWSKKENKIYYQWGSNLFSLDLDSKATAQLTAFDQLKFVPYDFSVSSDEQNIAYIDNVNGQTDLWQLPLQGGTPVQITHDAATERSPVWYPGSKYLIYKSITENSNQIFLHNLENNETTQIKPESDDGALTDISPDGHQILYANNKIEADIWKLDLDNPQEVPLTSGADVESWVDASPDGASIAYQAIKGTQGRWDPRVSLLFSKSIAPESVATELAIKAFDPQWSPDGKSIAFLRRAEHLYDLYVINAKGGEEQKLVSRSVQYGGQIHPSLMRTLAKDYCWSPDSSRIAYSFLQDEVSNIWAVATDGSGNTKISNNSDASLELKSPIWSPDGKRIAYISGYDKLPPNENQLWSLWVSDSDKPIFQSRSVLRLLGWSAGNLLIVASVENKQGTRATPSKVTLSKISTAGEQQIASLDATYLANLFLSPDGKNIAFVASQNGKENIYLIPASGGNIRQLTQSADPRLHFSTLNWSADNKALFYGKNEVVYGVTLIKNKGD